MAKPRWRQRFQNFENALTHLEYYASNSLQDGLDFGLIKAFELTYEMAWKTVKDLFADWDSKRKIIGSRDAFRAANQEGFTKEGSIWMEMSEDRNLTAHEYVMNAGEKVSKKIVAFYIPAFKELHQSLSKLA